MLYCLQVVVFHPLTLTDDTSSKEPHRPSPASKKIGSAPVDAGRGRRSCCPQANGSNVCWTSWVTPPGGLPLSLKRKICTNWDAFGRASFGLGAWMALGMDIPSGLWGAMPPCEMIAAEPGKVSCNMCDIFVERPTPERSQVMNPVRRAGQQAPGGAGLGFKPE